MCFRNSGRQVVMRIARSTVIQKMLRARLRLEWGRGQTGWASSSHKMAGGADSPAQVCWNSGSVFWSS